MITCKILFNNRNTPLSFDEISNLIIQYGESHKDAISEIIECSKILDKDGQIFIKCASRILKNFSMTRRGGFSTNLDQTLTSCWNSIGTALIDINQTILISGFPRDRYLLEISDFEREKVLLVIWQMTKELLPFTMGTHSYGLVGASKILFSVLPELVLPTDNVQWMQLFKTVDLGDVIRFMAEDIQKWERVTGIEFNTLDPSRRLTTLPSVYNVVALSSRPI